MRAHASGARALRRGAAPLGHALRRDGRGAAERPALSALSLLGAIELRRQRDDVRVTPAPYEQRTQHLARARDLPRAPERVHERASDGGLVRNAAVGALEVLDRIARPIDGD